MKICVEFLKSDINKIPKEIKYYIENDWIYEKDSCSITFQSLDDFCAAIYIIYPFASFTIEVINSSYANIKDFDNGIWQLKENRK